MCGVPMDISNINFYQIVISQTFFPVSVILIKFKDETHIYWNTWSGSERPLLHRQIFVQLIGEQILLW